MTNQEIFELIARFESSSLQSMKLSSGDFSLELDRPASAAPACAAPAAAPRSVDVPAAPAEEEGKAITAPLVGTYYAAPAPDAPAFVGVGSRVKKGETVCLIEAMKTISEIPAPCDCVITEVLKENGALASFQEALFRYRPC